MKSQQPPLYLITGIVIGFLVGILFSYVILPVRFTDTQPNTLSASQKEIFRALVARTYLYEGDSGRAFSRLALLNDENIGDQLVAQAQQMVASGEDDIAARGLALLASAILNPEIQITPLPISQPPLLTPVVDQTRVVLPTSTTIPATATPFATYTPRPTATLKATQGSPFTLVDSVKEVCTPGSASAQLMVYVYDKSGEGVPGVKLEISIPNGGQTYFFTGLYPEIDQGYADYEMMQGFSYSLRVGNGGEIVSGLSIPQCSGDNGAQYPGNLVLKFKQQ